ncbi:BRCT domain-containing protein [Vibrio thalassae]|nr:BRCT domain-containing protein [Vibrio thalassae]
MLYKDMDAVEMPLEDFAQCHSEVEEAMRTGDYKYDGVVFEVTSKKIKELMGSGSKHHHWQIAAKQNEAGIETEVTKVTFQVGRSGVLAPTVHFKKIDLDGSETTKATGHHAQNIFDNKIGVGAVVSVVKAGSVIPKIESVVTPATLDNVYVPTHCPDCGHSVIQKESNLYCSNDDCDARAESKIIHFFRTIEAQLFGRATVSMLVEHGFDSVEKVLTMDAFDYRTCGLGAGQAANLVAEVCRVRTEKLYDYLLIGALGISNLGRSSAKKILAVHRIEDMPHLSTQELLEIEGFGQLTAQTVSAKLRDCELLKFLLESTDFNLVHTKDEIQRQKKIVNASTSLLCGKYVVFTGKCTLSRSEMGEFAASLGAIPQKSITSHTDYLVCGERTGQTKMDAARAKGVTVLSETEFRELA